MYPFYIGCSEIPYDICHREFRFLVTFVSHMYVVNCSKEKEFKRVLIEGGYYVGICKY